MVGCVSVFPPPFGRRPSSIPGELKHFSLESLPQYLKGCAPAADPLLSGRASVGDVLESMLS